MSAGLLLNTMDNLRKTYLINEIYQDFNNIYLPYL